MNRLSFLSPRGSALVVTLAILTLVCILVVGLSDTMRVERASANMHLERERAADFAQMGVDRVVALLKTNIGDNKRSWVSAPGLLVCSSGSDFKLSKEIPLYSGVSAYSGTAAASCPAGCLPPDLNTVIVSDTGTQPRHLITNRAADPDNAASSTVELPLRWIYIRADGTWDPQEPIDLKNKTNPIIGRFAYWADDESSKVNYNTAWKRPLPTANTPPATCAINLLGLSTSGSSMMTTTMLNALHQAITKSTVPYQFVQRFFNSPQDARTLESAAPGISAMIESNKFALTHYNSDPDTTFFNEPRIVLTTHRQYVTQAADGSYPCIDILNDNAALTTDPGNAANINPTKYANTVAKLISYMQRADWPMVSGPGSMQSKYYAGNPDRLAQLALNIIDYVRCKESALTVVEPMRGNMTSGTFTITSDQTEKGFMGVTRTPLINEIGAWLSDDMKSAMLVTELYLPKHYGIDSLDLSNYAIGVEWDGISSYKSGGKVIPLEANILSTECDGGSATIVAGGYKVIRRQIDMTPLKTYATRPDSVSLRVDFAESVVTGTGGTTVANRLDIAPQVSYHQVTSGDQNAYKLMLTIDPKGTPQPEIQSREVDDPRVNKFQSDWKDSGPNSFGTQNNCYSPGRKNADSSITPPQDTDSGGQKISDASLYMPGPKGKGDNVAGLVLSPAELGVIHTGVQGSGIKGTPWRTLRLQPSQGGLSVVPDWAFMDLFTVPNTAQMQAAAKPLFLPHGTSVGGRVSVNAQVQPFGNPNFTACPIPLERVDPMVAALYSGSYSINGTGQTISLPDAKTLARAIYDHQLATTGTSFSQANRPGSLSKFYTSPGELAEIKGVADGGEESEKHLCFASNLITTRGNVFSIYTIGQALKQTPNNTLMVRGEQRLQSMVERYLDSSSGTVKFRTVYFRNLTP